MTSITNAVVLVTGANGGLGTALVRAALDRGAAKVYAAARTEVAHPDERVVPIRLDLADPASIDRAVANTGDTTILVNNAAVFRRSSLLDGPLEDLTDSLQINVVGPTQLARGLAGALRAGRGALVQVNSVLSWFPVGQAHSVSKAAAWMATNVLRLAFAGDGVQVLGVHPGPIDTPMQPGEDRSGMAAPADVAAAILDAVVAGEDELVIGPVAQRVHAALSGPVSALAPAPAQG